MHVSTVEAVLEYEVRTPSHLCFNIEAAHWPTQRMVSEQLEISPPLAPRSWTDPRSGNRLLRVDAPPGPLRVAYKAEVEVDVAAPDEELPEVPVSEVPDEVFRFLMPTRYCESDVLGPTAQKLFGHLVPGLSRVRAIVDWIHREIAYKPGTTNSMTSAQEVYVQRAGVCRDFAHLGISFCRALGIPARIVVGYVWFDEPPQDFHAVFEAWLGGRWVQFDPTGMAPVERLVRIGTGSDAKDVAFLTWFGELEMKAKRVAVLEHDPRPRPVVPEREPAPTA